MEEEDAEDLCGEIEEGDKVYGVVLREDHGRGEGLCILEGKVLEQKVGCNGKG